MSGFPIDHLYNEQRLTQEVLYLHSLWHQGPPRPHPTAPLSLQPSSYTQFKKKSKKPQNKVSDIEWPCPTPTPAAVSNSGWPTVPASKPHVPTAEELAYFAANQVHQRALKSVSKYFKGSDNSDSDDDDDADDDDDGGDNADEKFFVKLFAEESELREYYVNKGECGGEFTCLVCSGSGKKGWKKRYKDCVALVQHSLAISNTNTLHPHRAYARVICQILGWDINRLPSIVLSAPPAGNEDDGGKCGLNGLCQTTDATNVRSDEASQQTESFSNASQQGNDGGSAVLQDNTTGEVSATCSIEDISNNTSEAAKENTVGASTSLEPLQEDRTVANEH